MVNKAGKELDVLVAERVMGWRLEDTGHPVDFWVGQDDLLTGWCKNDWPCEEDWGDAPELFSGNGAWRPSTDWADMRIVIDALAELDWHLTLYAPGSYTDEGLGPGKGWTALFCRPTEDWHDCVGAFEIETAPLAICLAALEVMEEDNDP